jgi:hypothetical protein
MYGPVHQDEVRPRGLEPLNTGFSGVAGAVVHDPERALGRGVGLARKFVLVALKESAAISPS